MRSSFTSARMPRSTVTFLFIDAGSQSTWTIFARRANFEVLLPVTRSLKRTPSARRRSASAIAAFAANSPWRPASPSARGSVSSNEPMPIKVVATGIPALCASAATSFDAPDAITPPPARITGRFAPFMSFARRLTCDAVAETSGWYARRKTRSGYVAEVSACWQSRGTSITTGPGLPCVAI